MKLQAWLDPGFETMLWPLYLNSVFFCFNETLCQLYSHKAFSLSWYPAAPVLLTQSRFGDFYLPELEIKVLSLTFFELFLILNIHCARRWDMLIG